MEVNTVKRNGVKFNRKRSRDDHSNIDMEKAEEGWFNKSRLRVRKPQPEKISYETEEESESPPKRKRRRNTAQGRKNEKRQKGLAESVPSSASAVAKDTRKRTILSWLIDSNTLELNKKVWYKDETHPEPLLEGRITRDGILCDCCRGVFTVSEFEIHAGSILRNPYWNTFVDPGKPLFHFQFSACQQQEESMHRCSQPVQYRKKNGDQNDDSCGICGDGGKLICCDGCPSTFHASCLGLQMVPLGKWHCSKCSCKFCGTVCNLPSEFHTCGQCERRYHRSCVREIENVNRQSTFICEQNCREIFEKLKNIIGVKHDTEGGFSWTLLQRLDLCSDTIIHGVSSKTFIRGLQKIDNNSKLAVAVSVMDECFAPIIDRLTGTNTIQSVMYNCGSNFNRINYSGFYTVVLERGDEIISAACIRIHGPKIAEMPFIGTRELYWHKGMCRRLLNAVESVLNRLKVENLIIPSTAERKDMWIKRFGFNPIEESHKREMRTMNMLLFPKSITLYKLLRKHKVPEGHGGSAVSEVIDLEPDNDQSIVSPRTKLPDVADNDQNITCPRIINKDGKIVFPRIEILKEAKTDQSITCPRILNKNGKIGIEILKEVNTDQNTFCPRIINKYGEIVFPVEFRREAKTDKSITSPGILKVDKNEKKITCPRVLKVAPELPEATELEPNNDQNIVFVAAPAVSDAIGLKHDNDQTITSPSSNTLKVAPAVSDAIGLKPGDDQNGTNPRMNSLEVAPAVSEAIGLNLDNDQTINCSRVGSLEVAPAVSEAIGLNLDNDQTITCPRVRSLEVAPAVSEAIELKLDIDHTITCPRVGSLEVAPAVSEADGLKPDNDQTITCPSTLKVAHEVSEVIELKPENDQNILCPGIKPRKVAAFDLNLPPPDEIAEDDTQIVQNQKPTWGVFFAFHEEREIRPKRIRLRD